jgi:hypothetical protein
LAFSQQKPSTNIRHIEEQGTATQLIVDGKPFPVLGAEAALAQRPWQEITIPAE